MKGQTVMESPALPHRPGRWACSGSLAFVSSSVIRRHLRGASWGQGRDVGGHGAAPPQTHVSVACVSEGAACPAGHRSVSASGPPHLPPHLQPGSGSPCELVCTDSP